MDPSRSDADAAAAPGPGGAADGATPPGAPPAGWSALPRTWRGVPVLTILLLGFALSVLLGNYLPTRADTAATERALEDQRTLNHALAERIRRAEADAARIEHDPWTHERILRDELRMTRPGEVIVR